MRLSLLPLLLNLMLFASCYAALYENPCARTRFPFYCPYADTRCAAVHQDKGYRGAMMDLAPEQVINNMNDEDWGDKRWGDKVSSIR